MIPTLIIYGIVGLISFVAGIVFGAQNKASVDKAIADLKEAEANAQTTLDKITKHKAS